MTKFREDELTSRPGQQDQAHKTGAYDYLSDRSMYPRFALIGGFALLHQSATVLDVGCGVGLLRSFLSPETRYTGFDISPTAIARAKELHSHLDHTEFAVGDLSRFSKSAVYDCIVWAGVGVGATSGENVSDSWKETLKIFLAHLKPDGVLLVECIRQYSAELEPIILDLSCLNNHVEFECKGAENYANRTLFVARPKAELRN